MARGNALIHGSLFSGIGGFDLAAQWCGWKNAFHCEINEFCSRVLQFYWPKAALIKNIIGYDWKKWKGKIDVLSGGFPCQPFSLAGKRRGTADDRHLWPAMLAAIECIKPRWVVAENVRGFASWNNGLVFEQVCLDLETQGYQLQPFIIPAAGVGAPQRRERIFFVAYAGNQRRKQEIKQLWEKYGQTWEQVRSNPATATAGGATAHASGNGQFRGRKGTEAQNREQEPGEDRQLAGGPEGLGFGRFAANANGEHLPKDSLQQGKSTKAEQYLTGGNSRRLAATWKDFPTECPVCSGDDGLFARMDTITFSRWRSQSIQAYGNAVVPQVAYQFFFCIDAMTRLLKMR